MTRFTPKGLYSILTIDTAHPILSLYISWLSAPRWISLRASGGVLFFRELLQCPLSQQYNVPSPFSMGRTFSMRPRKPSAIPSPTMTRGCSRKASVPPKVGKSPKSISRPESPQLPTNPSGTPSGHRKWPSWELGAFKHSPAPSATATKPSLFPTALSPSPSSARRKASMSASPWTSCVSRSRASMMSP